MAKQQKRDFSTQYVYQMLAYQRNAATQHYYGLIDPGHMVLAMLRTKGSIASYILHQIGTTDQAIREALSEFVTAGDVHAVHPMSSARLEIHPLTNQLMEQTFGHAVEEKKWIVATDDFLFTIMAFEDVTVQAFLAKISLTAAQVREEFDKMRSDKQLLTKIPEAMACGLTKPTRYYRLASQFRSLFKFLFP